MSLGRKHNYKRLKVMKLFLTHSTEHLRRPLRKLAFNIGRYETYTFADGERGYRLKEKVDGESVRKEILRLIWENLVIRLVSLLRDKRRE